MIINASYLLLPLSNLLKFHLEGLGQTDKVILHCNAEKCISRNIRCVYSAVKINIHYTAGSRYGTV